MRTLRLILAAVLVTASAFAVGAEVTPAARVTGPLPVTDKSYPFGAADHTRTPQDPRKMGYVEEEYFFSGLANVYDWSTAGPATVRTPNAPYTNCSCDIFCVFDGASCELVLMHANR